MVAPQETSNSFRRRFPRRKFIRPVGMLHRGKYLLTVGDEIGEGGMSLRSDVLLPIHDRVVVNYFVPQKGFITATGQILYVIEGPPGSTSCLFGIKFDTFEFEKKRMVRDYIAHKTAQEAEEKA